MKIIYIIMFFIGSLSSMNHNYSDIDFEFWYMESLLTNLETAVQEFHKIADERKAIQKFKELCINYQVIHDDPIWISDIFNESYCENEQEPPKDKEEDE